MSANWRTGEAHPKAQASDELVRFMRALRERHGWSYGRLSAYTATPWRTVADIVNYRTRVSAGQPERFDLERAAYAHREFREFRVMFHGQQPEDDGLSTGNGYA